MTLNLELRRLTLEPFKLDHRFKLCVMSWRCRGSSWSNGGCSDIQRRLKLDADLEAIVSNPGVLVGHLECRSFPSRELWSVRFPWSRGSTFDAVFLIMEKQKHSLETLVAYPGAAEA